MKKFFTVFVALSILLGVLSAPLMVAAESNNNSDNNEESTEDTIASLREQVKALQDLVAKLMAQIEEAKEEIEEIKAELQLTRQLALGMRGDDVKLLQEFLATDPDIYPEGLITGYFGNLTKAAVQRFQKAMGVEQVGRVGPKTFTRINELLEYGVGDSGKVPPGLLRAPGIQKKVEQGLVTLPKVETENDNDEGENDEDNNDNGENDDDNDNGNDENNNND